MSTLNSSIIRSHRGRLGYHLNADMTVAKSAAKLLYSLQRRRATKSVPVLTTLRELVAQGGTVESYSKSEFLVTVPRAYRAPAGIVLQRYATHVVTRGKEGRLIFVMIHDAAHLTTLRYLLSHGLRWIGQHTIRFRGQRRPLYVLAADEYTDSVWMGNPVLHLLTEDEAKQLTLD